MHARLGDTCGCAHFVKLHADLLPASYAAGDGVYSYKTSDGSIVLEDVTTNTTRLLVDGEKVLDVSLGSSLCND